MALRISCILVFGDYSSKWHVFGVQAKKMDMNVLDVC